jgi:hypothetical protein
MKQNKEIQKINKDFYIYEFNHKYYLNSLCLTIEKRISEKQYFKLIETN